MSDQDRTYWVAWNEAEGGYLCEDEDLYLSASIFNSKQEAIDVIEDRDDSNDWVIWELRHTWTHRPVTKTVWEV